MNGPKSFIFVNEAKVYSDFIRLPPVMIIFVKVVIFKVTVLCYNQKVPETMAKIFFSNDNRN